MKKILFFLLIIASAKAQTVKKIEYFIDTDPGHGLGVNVPLTAAMTINTSFNYAVSSLTDGIHLIGIRSQDQNLFWSLTETSAFYKETIGSSSALSNVVKLEYFIDNDPGQGLGVDVPITAGTTINNQSFTYNVSSITDGIHLISVRAKTANGFWSIVQTSAFYKETIGASSALPNIVKLEYFIDNDPGGGLGTNIPITQATSLSNIGFSFNVNSLTDGIHLLSIRAKNADNAWSKVSTNAFYKETITTPPALPNIVAMEYFIDADPGTGAGTPIEIIPNTIKKPSIYADMTGLSNGTHKISIRAKDENDHWSIVGIKDFVVSNQYTKIKSLPPSYCRNTAFNIPFTAFGTYNTGNIFTAQISNSAGVFTSPTNIGSLSSTTSGNILATIPNSISLGTGYKIRIISSNPSVSDNIAEPISVVSTCDIQINTGNVPYLSDYIFCTGGTIAVPFTTYGTFQSGNQFIAQLSDANGNNFVNIPSVVNGNTIVGTIPDGLMAGDSYRIRVVASAPGIIGNEAPQSLRIRNSDQETILSTQSGTWNSSSVWTCSRIPVSQRTVVINAGQTITAPTGSTSAVASLTLNGTLNFGTNPAPNAALTVAKVSAVLTSGSLNVSNSFTMTSTAAVVAKIYSSTDYDKIIVAGQANLSGILTILLDAGYVPTDGNSFTIISYGSKTGTLTTINLPVLPSNLVWNSEYTSTGLVFTIKNFTAPANISPGTNTNCTATSVVLGNSSVIHNPPLNTVTNNALTIFPLGATTIIWTVTDASGNTKTASQIVTVVDNVLPTITAPANINMAPNSGCNAAGVVLGTPTTADNCTVASVTNNAPTTFPPGATNVVWTVTDGSGNTKTAVQVVTVTDNILPSITAPANVSATTNTGCTATGVVLGTPTSSDNCGAPTVTNNAPTAFPLGTTTIIWTATDGAGNIKTATQTVTVTDNVLPTITAPATVLVFTNTGCTATGVSLGTPITSDNCTVASTTNNAPATFALGNTTVVWTVTDASGNTKTASQTVTVVDNVLPTITAPAALTILSTVPITSPALGSPTTSDNCTVASVTNNAPATFPLGNTTVTWTVTDGSGNTKTAIQLVSIVACASMSTTKSGAWNDPTVWSCGRIPVATDPVTINSGHVITVPTGPFPVKNITYAGGTIQLSTGGNIQLNP
jgi:HYR domain